MQCSVKMVIWSILFAVFERKVINLAKFQGKKTETKQTLTLGNVKSWLMARA